MADGRRADGHDAELLRAVFIILAGALAFFVAVLLFWELRYVSAALAFPGLKPTTDKEAVVS